MTISYRHLRTFIFLLFSLFWGSAKAQLAGNIGQFQFSQLLFNPGYSGSNSTLRGQSIYRDQFKGIPGGPKSALLMVDAPVSNNLGVGGFVVYHTIGKNRVTALAGNVSYRLKLGTKAFCQFGMKAELNQLSNGYIEAFVWDNGDKVIEDYQSASLYKIGAGAFFKNNNFYAGLSSPNLLNVDPRKIYYNDGADKSDLFSNWILNCGAKYHINEFTQILPNLMIRYFKGRPLNYYLNLGVELNQTVLAGISIVNPMAYGIYTRVSVSPKLKIGYHYEIGLPNNQLAPFHTNEISLFYGFE